MEFTDKAQALELPPNQNPRPYKQAYYGSTPVPHPTNEAAKRVDAAKVMSQVNKAK